jgi:hypothetical protein
MPTENGQSSAVVGKKGAGAGQGNAPWGNAAANPKDQPPNVNIPGTSSFAANPNGNTAPAPKRRKNAASHPTNGGHASQAAPSHASGRRAQQHANTAMVPANLARETNMMTFEKTGAHLKDGHLLADDGQTVSVNGMSFFLVAFCKSRCEFLLPCLIGGQIKYISYASRPENPTIFAESWSFFT